MKAANHYVYLMLTMLRKAVLRALRTAVLLGALSALAATAAPADRTGREPGQGPAARQTVELKVIAAVEVCPAAGESSADCVTGRRAEALEARAYGGQLLFHPPGFRPRITVARSAREWRESNTGRSWVEMEAGADCPPAWNRDGCVRITVTDP